MQCDLDVGDVIKSSEFKFGFSCGEIIEVGAQVGARTPVLALWEREAIQRGEKIQLKEISSDKFRDDVSRAEAEFVVVDVRLVSLGSGEGGSRSYYEVCAQRLNDDGTFNPIGQKIKFRTSDEQSQKKLAIFSTDQISRGLVTKIRAMKATFL